MRSRPPRPRLPSTGATRAASKSADLPAWLGASGGSGSNLFSLFQPQDSTRPIYRALVAGLGKPASRWIVWGGAAIWRFKGAALLGALLGAFFVALSLSLGGALGWLGVVLGLVLLLAGAVVGGALGLALRALSVLPAVRDVPRALARCGARPHPAHAVARPQINEAAGLAEGPLTFGMLWEGPEGMGSSAARAIDLQVMTTDLTDGSPAQMPWDGRHYFFDPQEMREYFPERVVTSIEDHPASFDELEPGDVRSYGLERKQMLPLLPMPDPEDLPVLVAARMSLSFPILISAVPLYAIDWTRTQNRDAKKELRAGQGAPCFRRRYLPRKRQDALPQDEALVLGRRPVQQLPGAPVRRTAPEPATFALNLRGFHPDHPNPATEAEKVFLPKDNRGGFRRWHTRSPRAVKARWAGSWGHARDGAQLAGQQPGAAGRYRDRIAHVSLSGEEGGLNLNMGKDKIDVLAERGRLAAVALAEQFAGESPGQVPTWGWTNHRWTRYRVALAELQLWLSKYTVRFNAQGTPDTPAYRQVTAPGARLTRTASTGLRRSKRTPRKRVWTSSTSRRTGRSRTWTGEAAPVTRPVMRLVWRPDPRAPPSRGRSVAHADPRR